MPEEDKQKILNRGRFLEEKGYRVGINDFGVNYFDGNIKIMAYYERYEKNCGLDIKFPGNYHFQISWIAHVRDNLSVSHMEPLERILVWMDYLEAKYDKIVDYSYCDESYLLADEYIERKRKENSTMFPVRGLTYAKSKEQRKTQGGKR